MEIPSLIGHKYAYIVSDKLKKEQHLLFSDQSMLSHVPKYGNETHSFFELLLAHSLVVDDYPNWEQSDLKWLQDSGTIFVDEEGILRMNTARVAMLKDLYDHDVLCCSYYNKNLIDKYVSSGDLRYGNTLFTIPEQEYLNYMLNKAEFSNGLDLRNKYIHSTNSLDEQQQQRDYIQILKIMTLIVLKINEEFCLVHPDRDA